MVQRLSEFDGKKIKAVDRGDLELDEEKDEDKEKREAGEKELRLAGVRLRPRTNGPSRSTPIHRMTLRSLAELTEKVVTGLPENPKIGNIAWSPDGAHFAFTLTRETDIELWVAEVASATARRLGGQRLNAVMGSPIRWSSDSRTLVRLRMPVRPRSFSRKSCLG